LIECGEGEPGHIDVSIRQQLRREIVVIEERGDLLAGPEVGIAAAAGDTVPVRAEVVTVAEEDRGPRAPDRFVAVQRLKRKHVTFQLVRDSAATGAWVLCAGPRYGFYGSDDRTEWQPAGSSSATARALADSVWREDRAAASSQSASEARAIHFAELSFALIALVVVLGWRVGPEWTRFATSFPMSDGGEALSTKEKFSRAHVQLRERKGLYYLVSWEERTRVCSVHLGASGVAIRELKRTDGHVTFVPWNAIHEWRSAMVYVSESVSEEGVQLQVDGDRWELRVSDPAGTAMWGAWRIWRAHASAV
jgi:hypothetical protein